VLGPILILCHDLPDSVTSSVRLFAIQDNQNSKRPPKTASTDLEQLEIWAKDWGMRFNAKNAIYYPSTKNRINSSLLIITSFKKFKTTQCTVQKGTYRDQSP
jgi:hypothetical protein